MLHSKDISFHENLRASSVVVSGADGSELSSGTVIAVEFLNSMQISKAGLGTLSSKLKLLFSTLVLLEDMRLIGREDNSFEWWLPTLKILFAIIIIIIDVMIILLVAVNVVINITSAGKCRDMGNIAFSK